VRKLAIRQLLDARKYSASYHIVSCTKSVIFNLATDSDVLRAAFGQLILSGPEFAIL